MRVIFAGTPEFAVNPLQALIEQHDVVAVFTQPDRRAGRGKKLLAPPVKQVAQEHNIQVHQPTTLKDQQELIESFQADVMVVVAYGMILPAAILDIPRLGCINIHASLLPKWRGAAPIQRAIQAGDKQTGVAIMQMEAGLDTGPVFEMLSTEIKTDDTSASMHDRLSELGAQGILSTLNTLQQNPDLAPTVQEHDQATYAHKISKQEAKINWHQNADAVHNQIRAFVPWPVCETNHQQERIRIWQSEVVEKDTRNNAPGTILALEPDIVIACQDKALKLISLQRDGGKAVSSREFCNGYSLAVGDVFTSTKPS